MADAPTWPFVLFFAFFGLTFVTMLFFAMRNTYKTVTRMLKGKRKRDGLVALARARGFGYLAEDASRTRYFTGAPFAPTFVSRARDIVWGQIDGRVFETFAYTASGNSPAPPPGTPDPLKGLREQIDVPQNEDRVYQVTWVPLTGWLPRVRFSPDNAAWRALEPLGVRDLDVESREFNDRWKVACVDERLAHAVLTPRMIERLLEPDLQGNAIAIEGRALWMATLGVSDLSDLDASVAQLHSIADLIPPFLFEPRSDAPAGG